MYGTICEYQLRTQTAQEFIGELRDRFAPILATAAGLLSFTVVRIGSDDVVTIGIFADRSATQQSLEAAAGWDNARIGARLVAPPSVTTGDIPVRLVAPDATPGFAVIRHFEAKSTNAASISERVRAGLIPLLGKTPGFAAFALFVEDGQDRGGSSLSEFVDRQSAQAASSDGAAWVRQNVGDLLSEPPTVLHVGEVQFHYARSSAVAAQT